MYIRFTKQQIYSALCTVSACFSYSATANETEENLKNELGLSYYSIYVDQYDDFFNGAEFTFSRYISPSLLVKAGVNKSRANIAGVTVPLDEYNLGVSYRHHFNGASLIDFSVAYVYENYDFKGLDRADSGASGAIHFSQLLLQNIEAQLGLTYKKLSDGDPDYEVSGALHYQYSRAYLFQLSGAYSDARPFGLNVGLSYLF